jgi:uncharacterized protein YcbK (DUF882 family)
MSVQTYSRATQGMDKLSEHFSVREFACHDGSDKILIDDELVRTLECIRVHLGAPIRITSAYRTKAWNTKVGGETNSFHMRGMAADINADGWLPRDLYRIINTGQVPTVNPGLIGLGLYLSFVHVDVRGYRGRWTGKGVRL